MDAMAKWNYIVEQYKKNYNQSESFIQGEWENYFSELFDYKRILREIDTQRSIHLGSSVRVIPDIILRKDNTDVIDVELKKYNIPFSDTMEEQLKSYLKQLNISVGVIIGKEIRLYWFEYMENRMYAIRIDYTENNPDGAKFIELLAKNTFQKGKIKEFIKSKMQFQLNVHLIQSELNEELLKNLLEMYFGEKYTEKEVKEAMLGYKIIVKKEGENLGLVRKYVSTPVDPIGKVGSFISKKEAIGLFESKGQTVYSNVTFASKNRTAYNFWANPPIDFLKNNWSLILNDTLARRIYLFNIPAYSIHEGDLETRTDRNYLINLQIEYNDPMFTDSRSKYQFGKYLVDECSY